VDEIVVWKRSAAVTKERLRRGGIKKKGKWPPGRNDFSGKSWVR